MSARSLLGLVASLAATAGVSHAYTPLAFLHGDEVGHIYWQQVRDGQPIPFGIGNAGTPDITIPSDHPDLDEFEALELAFRAWEQVPGEGISFSLQATSTNTYGYDGENTIFFADLGDVGYGGITLITYETATGRLLDVDVHLNDHSIRWLTSRNDTDGEPLPCPCQGADPAAIYTNDVQGLATHEVGHVLGLDHSAVGIRESASTPTMYPRGIWDVPGDGTRPPNSRYRTPERDDLAGLRAAYPSAVWSDSTGAFDGVVHDRRDEPLFGAYVIAKDLVSGEEVGVMSGVLVGPFSEEIYRLEGLPPGTYEVRVVPIDGSPPGLVTPWMFGGISEALIPQKLQEADLGITYYPYAERPADATPLTLAFGETSSIDFRPPVFVSAMPRVLHPPRPFKFEARVNADATGPLVGAKFLHTVDGGTPVETTLPTTGETTLVPVPELPLGSLVDSHIELEDASGKVHHVYTRRLQVGLSGEPLILVSKTGLASISAIDSGTMVEVDETDLVLSFPLGQVFHRGRFGAYVASYGTDKVSFVPLSRAELPPTSPMPFDTDGDGLLNELEPRFGTDPDDPDTDGDLGLDGVELSERVYRSLRIGAPRFEVMGGTLAQDGETPAGGPFLDIAIWNVTEARWETGPMGLTPTGRWHFWLPSGNTYRVSYFHAFSGAFLVDGADFTGPAGGRVSGGLEQVPIGPYDPPPEDTGTDPIDGLDGAVGVFLPPFDITLASGTDPYGLALDPAQQFLYVTGFGSSKVIKIDTATHLVVATATVPANPKGIAVTPDGKRVYVASAGAQRVSVLDASSLATIHTIFLSGPAQYVAMPGDGSIAIVTAGTAGADLVFVDTATDQVVATRSSQLGGLVFLGAQVCADLSVAGTFIMGAHALAVTDAATQEVSIVDLGPSVYTTSGVAVHPRRPVGYAIHYSNPELVEFDLRTGGILRRMDFDFIDIRDIGIVIDSEDLEEPDGDGLLSVCDNCPYAANDAQTDGDFDGEGDACDLDACDPGLAPVGNTLTMRREPSGAVIDWEPVKGIDEYHLYRGYSIGTSFLGSDGYTHQCLENSVAETTATDPFETPPLTLFYYLLGTKCPIGVQQSSLGVGSNGNERTTLGGLTCPNFAPDPDEDGTQEFPEFADNCPLLSNPAQANADPDTFGDACDNCPGIDNQAQEDNELDGLGDVCDVDDDNDGILDDGDGSGTIGDHPCPGREPADAGTCDDNCRTVRNSPSDCDDDPSTPDEQCDTERDGIGDACDPDLDGDGILNHKDNCPTIANPDQEDADQDGAGDACDT